MSEEEKAEMKEMKESLLKKKRKINKMLKTVEELVGDVEKEVSKKLDYEKRKKKRMNFFIPEDIEEYLRSESHKKETTMTEIVLESIKAQMENN